jgi:hypothetical protein
MSRRLRAPLAFLLALVVGVSFDFRSILHAHEDWQQNLRAHELARIDRTKGCDAAPHFDRAHSEIEPACAACLAAATRRARHHGARRRTDPARLRSGRLPRRPRSAAPALSRLTFRPRAGSPRSVA